MENLSPQVIRNVAKEVGELCAHPVEGVKIYPSEDDITNIQATIEGPGKSYKSSSCLVEHSRTKECQCQNYPSEDDITIHK